MPQKLNIGIIGDYNPDSSYHIATENALRHSAAPHSTALNVSWLPTQVLAGGDIGTKLKPFHGLWCSPGSPYNSMAGALQAIRFAREQGRPFVGT